MNNSAYFLSRPRRFGKSLTVDTIAELFKGNKPLFESLWIADQWDWSVKHPVIRAGNDEGLTGDALLEFVDRQLFPTLRTLDLSAGNQRVLIVREVFDGNNNYMNNFYNKCYGEENLAKSKRVQS